MMEVAYYSKFEAGFVSFPAENYVDYMTNVMPVLERHVFYLLQRRLAIVCEIDDKKDEPHRLWHLQYSEDFPDNTETMRLATTDVNLILDSLMGSASPCACKLCEKMLYPLFR